MNKEVIQLYNYIKDRAQSFLTIGLGIFLFVLFFQPFLLASLDFNNKLIFIAGLGAIVFLFTTLITALTYSLRKKLEISEFLNGFAIVTFSSVAFAFYLRYVGKEEITFYTMFKVVLICLISPMVLKILRIINELKQQNASILKDKKELQKQLETYENENLYQTIDFLSENSSESLSLMASEVMLIKSADNYIEVVYQEGVGNIKKKLLRSTLKNIEVQLKTYPIFVRCHRICIVNTLFIEKIEKDYSNHWLVLKGYDEKIPVSRQYLLKLKESI